jgi:predicted nucleic acid-binding Zn ribbon protein
MSEHTQPDSTQPNSTQSDSTQANDDVAARALRRATGASSSKAGSSRLPRTPRRLGEYRDPQLLGSALDSLLADQGWTTQTATADVLSRWAEIVGADLAEHVSPQGFHEGELILIADSTTWATQVRLLLPQVHQTLDKALGKGVINKITIHGPTAPSWVKGPRRVKGRGPRDTYG